MVLRYAEFRIDGSSFQTLPDGSVKVTGHLTHSGIFSYRNPDGTERREYRPKDEVFSPASLASFALAPVTINHPPRNADGTRLVNAKTWKNVTVGHLGENIRQDGDHMAADVYVREEGAIARIKAGDLRKISLGYTLDYEPTPGTTESGQRYDGVQRNIRGNHVALLPNGVAPRGGESCVLRLDSSGDEEASWLNPEAMNELEKALAQVAVLTAELAKSRTDAADAASIQAKLTTAEAALADARAQLEPARLDSLVAERSEVVRMGDAAGVETKGKATVVIKRAIVAKRTPALAARVDSFDNAALDACLAVYAEQPHPTMAAAVAVVAAPVANKTADRTDATDKTRKTVATIHEEFVKRVHNAWRTDKDDAHGAAK